MKKQYLLFFLFFFIANFSVCQQSLEFYSGLRNSQNIYGGSARFTSMGGAFTALGGDISSISLNPAGLGVYSGFQLVLTPTFQKQTTKTTTIGINDQDSKHRLNFHNMGLISSFDLSGSTRWESVNFAFGYNQMNDHSSALKANYFNTDQSLMHNFMDNYYQYGESSSYETLALETGLMYSYVANNDTIGPVTDPTFTMNYSDTASMDEIGVRQVKTIENKGSLGEYFLSISGNYAHKLYVGFSFGMQRVNFKSQDSHQEIDETNRIDQFDEITDFNSFKFTIHDERSGTGYNFKFGAIYKPTDFLRLGASYHSPTFFNLENIWYSSMVHNKNNYEINTAESSNKKFKYELTTPSKFLGGIAIKFKNIGLLSFDYERINYSQIELSASDEFTDFSSENNSYNQFLGNVNNFRAGGEIKLDHIYFRVGYSYYDSPYKDNYNNLHSATQIYSTGIGYREKSFFIDAAFSASFSEEKSYIFDTISNTTGLVPERVNMEKSRNKIILTAGLRF